MGLTLGDPPWSGVGEIKAGDFKSQNQVTCLEVLSENRGLTVLVCDGQSPRDPLGILGSAVCACEVADCLVELVLVGAAWVRVRHREPRVCVGSVRSARR